MSGGPPPVPGGRTEAEREAARLERERRRVKRSGRRAPAPPDAPARSADGTTAAREIRRLLSREGRGPGRERRPPSGSARRALLVAIVVIGIAIVWFLASLFQPFKGYRKISRQNSSQIEYSDSDICL